MQSTQCYILHSDMQILMQLTQCYILQTFKFN